MKRKKKNPVTYVICKHFFYRNFVNKSCIKNPRRERPWWSSTHTGTFTFLSEAFQWPYSNWTQRPWFSLRVVRSNLKRHSGFLPSYQCRCRFTQCQGTETTAPSQVSHTIAQKSCLCYGPEWTTNTKPWGMDGGWTGNIFSLGFSSLALNPKPWLAQKHWLTFRFSYLPTTNH